MQWEFNLPDFFSAVYVLDSMSQAAWFSLYFWNMSWYWCVMSDFDRMQDSKCYVMLLTLEVFLFACECNTSKTNAFLYVAQSFAQWSAAHCFHLLLRHITVHWSVRSCVLFCFLKVSYNEDYFHSLRLPLHQV